MVTATGVHLLPSTGEYAYDTIPFIAAQHSWTTGLLFGAEPINTYFAPGGSKTDYSYAMDQLQAAHPECTTVSVVVSWFFNSEDAATCNIYPSTIFLLGEIWQVESGVPVETHWTVSGLTEQDFPGIIPLPTTANGSYVYGGTPSDPSIVRCIRDLKKPRLQGGVLSVPARDRVGLSLARPDRLLARYFGGCDGGRRRVPRLGLGRRLHPGPGQSDGRLRGREPRLDLSPDDPALRQPLLRRGRREPVRHRLGTEGSRGDSRSGLDAGRNDGRLGQRGLGLPLRRRTHHPGERRPERIRRCGPDQESLGPRKPDHLFGRLVELDGLPAPGRKRPMAAPRFALRFGNIDFVCFDNYLPLTDWTTGQRRPRRD